MDPSSIEVAYLALPPLAALWSLWIKQRRYVGLVLAIVAILCWRLLLYSMSLRHAAMLEAYNRANSHGTAELVAFGTDGASNAFAFLFGAPIFVVYCLLCVVLTRAGRALYRRIANA